MDQNELRRKALMDQMGGNTGIAGVPDVSKLAPPPAAAPAPMPASPLAPDIQGGMNLAGKTAKPDAGNLGSMASAIGAGPSFPDAFAPDAATAAANRAKLTGPLAEILGGITGDPTNAPSAHDYSKLGQFSGQMGAWSEGDPNKPGNEKFARPWDDRSERYQMLSVLSNFDPTKGITPEALDALNKANIHGAKFLGSGDKLTVDNAGGWDRFGNGGTADIIQGLKSGHGTWSPWSDPAQQAQAAPAAPTGGGSFAGPLLGPGDAQTNIAAQLAAMTKQSPNLAALIAQLGGQQ